MKFFSNMLCLAVLSTTALAAPAFGADNSVGLQPGKAISAVYDTRDIKMDPLPGGVPNLGFEANPEYFRGAELCLTGRDMNWAIKGDGSLDQRDPARRMSCAPISADGQASVPNPFGPTAVPVLKRGDHFLAWAGRDRLTGGLVE